MQKRLLSIGDTHGCYGALLNLMDKIAFNPKMDTIVFMGDYIDRQSDSKNVILYLTKLKEQYPENIILLKGNHEDMAVSTDDPNMKDTWACNGAKQTLQNFDGDEAACMKVLRPFVESLQLYHETETHIFVHAGVPADKSIETAVSHELLWDRTGWWFGKKHLVIGHTPKCSVTVFGGYNDYGTLTYVDTGCCFGNALTAYEVHTGKVIAVGNERERVIIDVTSLYNRVEEDNEKPGERHWITSYSIDHYIKQSNQLTREACGLT